MAPKDPAPYKTVTSDKQTVATVEIEHRDIDNLDNEDLFDKICDGKQQIISFKGSSQYGDRLGTRISASTCGLAALNFARIAFRLENERGLRGMELLNEILSRQISEDVTSLCDYWKSNSHLEIEELLKVPIFKNSLSLQSCTYSNASRQRFFDLFQDMQDASPDRSVAVIITRPPEILACLRTRIADKDVYIIFDSHPRPSHPDGLGFIINPNIRSAASYLGDLLTFDETILGDPSLQWQAQLLGYFSGHILLPLDDVPSAVETLLDSSLALLTAFADIANEKSRNSDLEQKIKELERQQRFMEDRVRYLERQRREEHERYADALRSKEGKSGADKHSGQREGTYHRQTSRDYGSRAPASQAGPSETRRVTSSAPATNSGWQTVQRKEKGKGRVGQYINYGLALTGKWGQSTTSSHGSDRAQPSSPRGSEKPRTAVSMPGGILDDGFDRDAALAAELQRKFEEEDRQLVSQARTLQRMAPSTFKCSVCFDEYPEDYIARVSGCDHSFCRGCLRDHARFKIYERRFPIFCPTCIADPQTVKPGVIDQNIVQQIGVSDEDYQIFEELQITSFCIPLHCRRCKETMFVDRGEYQEATTIVCPWPGCQCTWCKACQQQIEVGGPNHSCDGSSELRHLMQQQGWKNCPGCMTPVLKSEGCNHMTCIAPTCNSHFCYLDGEMIIKGGTRKEIQAAIGAHYSKCKLFDYN